MSTHQDLGDRKVRVTAPVVRSFRMMPDPMIADRGLSSGTKILYMVMRLLAKGNDRMSGVSTADITALTGEDRRSFSRRFRELERAGWVRMHGKKSRYFEVEFAEVWPYAQGQQSPSAHRDTRVPVRFALGHHGPSRKQCAQGHQSPSDGTPESQCASDAYKEPGAELNSIEERQERPCFARGAAHPSVDSAKPPSKKRSTKKRRLRAGMLPLADVDALPVVLSEADAPLHAHIMSLTKTQELSDGNRDTADHVVREFRTLVAKGYTVAVVKKAINDTIKKGLVRDPDRFSAYLAVIFEKKNPDPLAGLPDAPPHVFPSQTEPMKYFTAPSRPKPPVASQEGQS